MAIVHNGCLISLPDPMYHRRSSLTWSRMYLPCRPVDRKTTRQLHHSMSQTMPVVKSPRFDESYYRITPCSDLVLMELKRMVEFPRHGVCCRVRLAISLRNDQPSLLRA